MTALTVPFLVCAATSVFLLIVSGPFWRRIRVFVSFEHKLEPIAEEIANALGRTELIVERVQFDTHASHDEVLSRVRGALQHCDAVVCLPGTRSSFVESEILVASTMRRLIVFVVSRDSPRVPNTAMYGYPVFVLEKLQHRGYRELASGIKLGCGSWLEWWRYLNSGNNPWSPWGIVSGWKITALLLGGFLTTGATAGSLMAGYLGGSAAVYTFLAELPSTIWDVATFNLSTAVSFFMGVGIVLGGLLLAVGARRAQAVFRQHTATGEKSFTILRRAIGGTRAGRRLLVCLLREPPKAYHELPSTK